MANRFFNPNEQFCDATGTPYAGGSLTFYASGTTTPLNTYQDKALTIANTNPVVLDSAGRANSVFLQNLAYKVILEDVNSNVIWTMDPVYASDFSTTAQFLSGSGSPNGSVAGSAGSATIPASSYWDFTNQILYICIQTGTISTAVWTAINSGSASNSIPQPQGYLTPTSGIAIITADVISATNVFYTPYVGNLIPIYNGTSFVLTAFAELNLALSSSQSSNGIYDVFVFSNSGVVTIAAGPGWSNATAGSCSRGTGAGTTQLSRVNGIWTNAVSISGKNGSNTYTIPANQGTYVGSIFIDGTSGQITCHRTYGQSRKWAVWNTYHRVPVYLKAGDSTANWSYNSATFRQSNAATANNLTVFSGLAEDTYDLRFLQKVTPAGTGSSGNQIGIGFNSTTATSGFTGQFSNTTAETAVATIVSQYTTVPALGINQINPLEASTGTSTFFGTETNMVLSALWRA